MLFVGKYAVSIKLLQFAYVIYRVKYVLALKTEQVSYNFGKNLNVCFPLFDGNLSKWMVTKDVNIESNICEAKSTF